MFKKILITTAVLAITTSVALANSAPYIGISAGERTNTTKISISEAYQAPSLLVMAQILARVFIWEVKYLVPLVQVKSLTMA